jgi:hypothetical protein
MEKISAELSAGQWPDLPSPPSSSGPSPGSRPPEPPQEPPRASGTPGGPPERPEAPRKFRWWWPPPNTRWGVFYYAVLAGLFVWLLITVVPHIHPYISVTWRLAFEVLEALGGGPGLTALDMQSRGYRAQFPLQRKRHHAMPARALSTCHTAQRPRVRALRSAFALGQLTSASRDRRTAAMHRE